MVASYRVAMNDTDTTPTSSPAAKTDDPAQIQARFVSPNFPLGRAVNLAACRGSLCPDECAIK